MEIWKDVRGYEGLYEVSNLGNVRRDGRLLKPHKRKRDGYYDISLCKNGVQANKRVHRLVAEAFVPNTDNLAEVNHKNENKGDNRSDNLEWCSRKANCNHGTRNERIAKKHSRAVEQLLCGVIVNIWPSACEAGRAGYDRSLVIQCCNGHAKTHKGYQWRWRNE